jgi:hypothetical protein
MPNRVSFGLSFILFSKTSHQTHLNQQRNVVLYHLFALVSRENWLGLLKKATLIFAHVCFAQTWARDDKGRFVWTVEHVLPKAEKLPDHWVKMIAEGDRQKAADLQDKWVHRLGNLTLSGYNSDLGTTSFEKKQKLSKDRNILGHKIDIGYRNNLFLNSLAFKTKAAKYSLADAPHWDAQMIEARTNVLVDMIADANLLPGEKASRKR